MPVPARRLHADPRATMIVVEHRDRLARFGVEHLEAALSAQARRLVVVVDPGETGDDLAGDMVEVLTGACARPDGRRGARNRALRAVTCAGKQPGHGDAAGTQGRWWALASGSPSPTAGLPAASAWRWRRPLLSSRRGSPSISARAGSPTTGRWRRSRPTSTRERPTLRWRRWVEPARAPQGVEPGQAAGRAVVAMARGMWRRFPSRRPERASTTKG
jgi:hypothetical protein